MRRLLIGAVVIVALLVIIAAVLTVPPKGTNLQKGAAIFLGILTGIAAIAEIVGLMNHLKSPAPENPSGDLIVTEGDYSPGKVGRDYAVKRGKKAKQQRKRPRTSSSTQATSDSTPIEGDYIRTHGDYSPGKVEGDYEVNNG